MSLGNSAYSIHFSTQILEPAWDDFVSRIPGGEFEQTSMWARAKEIYGWTPLRCLIMGKDGIQAGFQLLKKKLKGLVNVGYISRGPLFADDKSQEMRSVIVKLMKQAVRRFHIMALVVHPPVASKDLIPSMQDNAFYESSLINVIKATLKIDLSKDIETIFSGFKSTARKEIRQGYRRSTKVRSGNRSDIEIFFKLMLLTCKRHGVKPNPSSIEFFNVLWDVFRAHRQDSIKIFIAENKGQPLAACWNIAFGDTVRCWKGGWTGENARLRPNQMLVWESIKWAKRKGFKYFDFFGINGNAAVSLKSHRLNCGTKGRSAFKLKFGGFPVYYPPAFLFVTNPLVRLPLLTILKLSEEIKKRGSCPTHLLFEDPYGARQEL